MFLSAKSSPKWKRKDNITYSNKQSARLPPILCTFVLNHLIHDEKFTSDGRHVCNLKAPLNQSDGKYPRDKKFALWQREEYFQELYNAKVLKFLMLVLFLDQDQHHKSDSFNPFLCLCKRKFHSCLWRQTHQAIIDKFFRLYLSSKRRIDGHLNSWNTKSATNSTQSMSQSFHQQTQHICSYSCKEQIWETEQLIKNLVHGSIRQQTKSGAELLGKLMRRFECDAAVDMVKLKRESEQIQLQMSTQEKAFCAENIGKEKGDTLSETLHEWIRSVCVNFLIILRDL